MAKPDEFSMDLARRRLAHELTNEEVFAALDAEKLRRRVARDEESLWARIQRRFWSEPWC